MQNSHWYGWLPPSVEAVKVRVSPNWRFPNNSISVIKRLLGINLASSARLDRTIKEYFSVRLSSSSHFHTTQHLHWNNKIFCFLFKTVFLLWNSSNILYYTMSYFFSHPNIIKSYRAILLYLVCTALHRKNLCNCYWVGVSYFLSCRISFINQNVILGFIFMKIFFENKRKYHQ